MAFRRAARWQFVPHCTARSPTHIQSIDLSKQRFRSLQTISYSPREPANFAFAFDIDGVLLRSSKRLPKASKTLGYLQRHFIPFILLTNGGGKRESERVKELSQRLYIPLKTSLFIQSHTPFAELVHGDGTPEQPAMQDKCILVVGGHRHHCREVAENYGFKNVLTPADLITTYPSLWPFADTESYKSYGRDVEERNLPPKEDVKGRHLLPGQDRIGPSGLKRMPKIDAIFVFNDPRDWALDTQIILDLLLSQKGYLGSISPKNDDPSLPNRGYLQDGQPPLYYSNPDLLWAAEYHLPRLGQGGFREAFKGVWDAVTGGEEKGVKLGARMFGKPYQGTYEFAERRLQAHRNQLLDEKVPGPRRGLKTVYMVGDNPASDILGANTFASPTGTKWQSILVRTGVYSGGEPAHKPTTIVDNVWEALWWGLAQEGWEDPEIDERAKEG